VRRGALRGRARVRGDPPAAERGAPEGASGSASARRYRPRPMPPDPTPAPRVTLEGILDREIFANEERSHVVAELLTKRGERRVVAGDLGGCAKSPASARSASASSRRRGSARALATRRRRSSRGSGSGRG